MEAERLAQTDAQAALLEQAAAWKFLHDLFRQPGEGQWRWLNEHAVREAWGILSLAWDCQCPEALPLPADPDEYEHVYLAAFEVGTPQPPCPLIESHWNKHDTVARVLRENILFYRQFGLQLRSSANETADHLRHQLEFLHHLCRLEADCLSRPDRQSEASQAARGRDEYLQRRVGSWVTVAARSLAEAAPDTWPSHWMNLLSASCSS